LLHLRHASTVPHRQLREAEERSAIAESEVRQEVATEMRELLVQMENNYKVGVLDRLPHSADPAVNSKMVYRSRVMAPKALKGNCCSRWCHADVRRHGAGAACRGSGQASRRQPLRQSRAPTRRGCRVDTLAEGATLMQQCCSCRVDGASASKLCGAHTIQPAYLLLRGKPAETDLRLFTRSSWLAGAGRLHGKAGRCGVDQGRCFSADRARTSEAGGVATSLIVLGAVACPPLR